MENSKTTTQSADGFRSTMVSKFISDLRNGTSVLQQPHKDPSYVRNVASGTIMKDINAIIVAQGLKDNGKKANLVITQKQKDDKRYINDTKSEAIATALFDDSRAYFQEKDPEVVTGKAKKGEHKKDANGNFVPDTIYSLIYAAEDLVESKFEKAKDENGNYVKYEEDVPYLDGNNNPVRYTKSGSYEGYNGEMISYNAGDVKIKHKAGSYVGDYVATDKRVTQPQPTILPKLLNDDDLAPLYKKKNDSGREVLLEGLTKAFRGMMQGDSDGWKPSVKDIDAIEKDFLTHPREFRGIVKSAWTRAEGDKVIVAKMDERIKEKEMSQSKTQEQTETKTKKRAYN